MPYEDEGSDAERIERILNDALKQAEIPHIDQDNPFDVYWQKVGNEVQVVINSVHGERVGSAQPFRWED
jgi:hypothetical protein